MAKEFDATAEPTTDAAELQEKGSTDPLDINFGDLLTRTTEQADHTPPAEDDEEQVETSAEEDEEDARSDEPDEDQDESEDFDIPSLDAELAKNPKAKAVWDRQWRGVLKREEKLKASEQVLSTAQTYWRAFENPQQAPDALKVLVEQVAKMHGRSPEDFLGIAKPTAEEDDPDAWTSGSEYASKKEYELEKAQKSLAAELAALKAERDSERQKSAQQAEFNNFIEREAPKIIKRISREMAGFEPTKQMVAEALRALPMLANDPVKAVKAHFVDDIAKHFAKQSSKAKRAPDMVQSVPAKGVAMPKDATQITFSHILKARNSSG